jgi:hypothetical protein
MAQGTGNIGDGPLFVDRASDDYRLLAHSPCVNAGTNRPWMTRDTVDLAGMRRLDRGGGSVDIGAYEYQVAGTMMLLR